jgi:hypothetical protein
VSIDHHLQKIYFPIKPICSYLSDQAKEKFLHIKRDSPSEKLRDLMEASENMMEEMNHHATVANSKYMMSEKTTFKYIRDISTFIALVINILILSFMQINWGK